MSATPPTIDELFQRAIVLHGQGRLDEAAGLYLQVLALAPNHAEALYLRGRVLRDSGRFQEAAKSFAAAATLKPDHAEAASFRVDTAIRLCDWSARGRDFDELRQRSLAGQPILPGVMLVVSEKPADQQRIAQNFAGRFLPARPALGKPRTKDSGRIRLAYVSADFVTHPVATLSLPIFKHHERAKFDVTAISLRASDNSPIRKKLEATFDEFIDAQSKSDEEIARLMAEKEIDIAIDLTGFTGGCRPGIFSYRPAPLQVSFLGYPGTMGTEHIDYLVADRYVIPEQTRQYYSEKIVYLPDTLQPNDSRRGSAEPMPSRRAAGLPEKAFVFCCFNNVFKLSPEMFDIWARLLKRIPNSVLWFNVTIAPAIANLVKEAAARGISSSRLVFAPYAPNMADHVARMGAADVFLDTLPYNAHTTASDALWAGLPVVTCSGETYAARVAGSLLHAIGLPELVTTTLEDYESLALKLAQEPALLNALREKLARNRATAPLFDAPRFCRNLEAAYDGMWGRHVSGASPQSFAVM